MLRACLAEDENIIDHVHHQLLAFLDRGHLSLEVLRSCRDPKGKTEATVTTERGYERGEFLGFGRQLDLVEARRGVQLGKKSVTSPSRSRHCSTVSNM